MRGSGQQRVLTSGGIRLAGILLGRGPGQLGWATVCHELKGPPSPQPSTASRASPDTQPSHHLSSPQSVVLPAAGLLFMTYSLGSLSLTGTWSCPPLPPGRETTGLKWSRLC